MTPEDIKTQWQEARANRRMQFKVDDCKDSNIRMLTGTIKADWILPVERYLAALPTLKQGVIIGVFKIKGASPWAITRAEKSQVSVFLPNDLSLDEWYAGVYVLPTVWPDWEPAISNCVAHLEYFTEPAMAATSASSTLRV